MKGFKKVEIEIFYFDEDIITTSNTSVNDGGDNKDDNYDNLIFE